MCVWVCVCVSLGMVCVYVQMYMVSIYFYVCSSGSRNVKYSAVPGTYFIFFVCVYPCMFRVSVCVFLGLDV